MERKSTIGSVNNEKFDDFKLNLLGTALNGFLWDFNFSNNVDNTLIGDSSHILDHFLWHVVTLEGNSLDGGESFSKDDEAVVSFGSDVVDSGSDENFLVFECLVELFDIGPISS